MIAASRNQICGHGDSGKKRGFSRECSDECFCVTKKKESRRAAQSSVEVKGKLHDERGQT